jgi:UDP-glucose:(heptosyl)LPS alpha-1,3-glucosyltransferase
VKRAVREWYALDDAYLPILFNAVDLQKYDPSALPGARVAVRSKLNVDDEQCVALFVGHDFERKGLREAVLALRGVRDTYAGRDDRRLMLLVVGRPRLDKYLALARRYGVQEQVVAMGPADDVVALYRAADFLVLPTKHDPGSLVVLEALATGLPVISTRFNGASEIMVNGVHGFVLDDPTDVVALADAMRQMLDPALRQRMSQACVELRPRLSYDNHLRTLLGIYQRVVGMRA